jgi:hypothetical protein
MPPIELNKPTDDQGTYFPNWDCFACQDSGTVPDHLARMLPGYEDYDSHKHKNLRCRCSAGSKYECLSNAFDNSLTHDQMRSIHYFNHANWISTAKAIAEKDEQWAERRKQVEDFLQSQK